MRSSRSAKDGSQRGRIALLRQNRNHGADERSGGVAAALASPLVVHEEIAQLAARGDGTAGAGAEDILFDNRAGQSLAVEEEIVGIENGVAKELEEVEMIIRRAGFQDGVDIAAAVAALRGIVETGANFEFLNDIGARKRRIVEFSNGIVVGADAFDLVIVVVIAAAIDVHADSAAAKLGSRIERRGSARRKGKQLLKILRGQWQTGDRRAQEGFSSGCVGRANGEDVGRDLNRLGN